MIIVIIKCPASLLLHVAVQIVLSFFSSPHFVSCSSLLFFSPTSPCLHVCLLVSVVVVVAVQVGNMNYLAGRRCSAWKTAVSMVRMDEERQERDETDSSSQPSSIHPSTRLSSLSLSLSLAPSPSLCTSTKNPWVFFPPKSRYKEIFATTFRAKNRIVRLSCHMGQHSKIKP